MTGFPLFASNIPTAVRFSRYRRTSILNVPTVVAIIHGTLFQEPFSRVPAHACRSGTLLNCKKHYCPSKCHRTSDHSRMHCEVVLSTRCAAGHIGKWKCHDGPRAICGTCKQQRQAAEAAKAEASASLEQREVRGVNVSDTPDTFWLIREAGNGYTYVTSTPWPHLPSSFSLLASRMAVAMLSGVPQA